MAPQGSALRTLPVSWCEEAAPSWVRAPFVHRALHPWGSRPICGSGLPGTHACLPGHRQKSRRGCQ